MVMFSSVQASSLLSAPRPVRGSRAEGAESRRFDLTTDHSASRGGIWQDLGPVPAGKITQNP
jgi:hypothetical protein